MVQYYNCSILLAGIIKSLNVPINSLPFVLNKHEIKTSFIPQMSPIQKERECYKPQILSLDIVADHTGSRGIKS